MTNYIETQARDGSEIRIEVEDVSKIGAGFSPKSAPNVTSETAKDAYNQTLNAIRACANGIADTIQSLEMQPNAASIDFAIKIDAEAGAMIAKSREAAQFRVSLSWKQEEEKQDEAEVK